MRRAHPAARPHAPDPPTAGLELHASLGSVYLGSLDLHRVKRIRIRAYACMGVPHSLTGTRMGLRRQEYRYHPDTAANDIIAKEGSLVLPHLPPWRGGWEEADGQAVPWAEPLLRSVHGSYYPGIMSIVSMVSRSTTLEVLPTHACPCFWRVQSD